MMHFFSRPKSPAADPLPPVMGDLLPAIGSRVEIYLARSDKWVTHTVVGYYVWGPLRGEDGYRVFVRVRDDAGFLNARPLAGVRLA
jgi:hypothetical protein